MNAKDYLSQISSCNMRLKSMARQIESIDDALGCHSPQYSDLPKSPTRCIHRMEGLIAAKIDIEREMASLAATLADVHATINKLTNPVHAAIITGRYICDKTWGHIAAEIHYSVRHTHELHQEALDVLETFLQDRT
jgi:hypothetical protein